MARQKVIEISCDRCTRVEHRALSDFKDRQGPAFEGTFMGAAVKYDDLCTGCEEIVGARWNEITRELSKASPIRQKGKEETK